MQVLLPLLLLLPMMLLALAVRVQAVQTLQRRELLIMAQLQLLWKDRGHQMRMELQQQMEQLLAGMRQSQRRLAMLQQQHLLQLPKVTYQQEQ
jgi:TRAP-type uncharacterized transport system fused permease subunit